MIYRLIILIGITTLVLSQGVFAAPDIHCGNLPGCGESSLDGDGIFGVVGNIIATLIKYVAVIAVLAVMYGGITFLTSDGNEERTKKARNIIIWALAGVFLSVAAWSLINIVNNFRI